MLLWKKATQLLSGQLPTATHRETHHSSPRRVHQQLTGVGLVRSITALASLRLRHSIILVRRGAAAGVAQLIVNQRGATFITEGSNVIKQIRPRAAPLFHTGCLVLVTGIKIHFVVLHLARGPQVAHPCCKQPEIKLVLPWRACPKRGV